MCSLAVAENNISVDFGQFAVHLPASRQRARHWAPHVDATANDNNLQSPRSDERPVGGITSAFPVHSSRNYSYEWATCQEFAYILKHIFSWRNTIHFCFALFVWLYYRRFRLFEWSGCSEHVTRFTKREKKLKPKCLPNSGCLKKIRRLERNLVLKEVVSRKGCLPLEVEANSRWLNDSLITLLLTVSHRHVRAGHPYMQISDDWLISKWNEKKLILR